MGSFRKLLAIILSVAVSCQAKQPHIITILIDDLGWNDVGFHGTNQIKTPNIDALAYSGMILNRHYVLPSCTPSRSALLTGLYAIRTGLQGMPLKAGETRNLPLEFQLKPEYLKQLGYRTHMVGKWHLGYRTKDYLPNQRGFDSFFGYYNGYVDYFKFGYNQTVIGEKVEYFYGYDLHKDNEVYREDKETYATRLFTREAEKVIKNHNASEPLYLYFSHLATHTGDDDIGMEVPEDADVNKTYSHIKDYGRRAFAGCLEELDKSVGAVVQALKEKNMLENSIILVMSDNGAHTVSVDMPPNWSSNWPLGGTKFTIFEGGIRGVALIWSPLLPKGVINEEFIHITDWLPTFYSAAGGNTNDLGLLDGIDQWAALQKLSTKKRNNILINIDDKTELEGIIYENRWKIGKGGYFRYGNYDYHWGREINSNPNPINDFNDILNSAAGEAIQTLDNYKNILNHSSIAALRSKSIINCENPENKIPMDSNGFIEASANVRCKDYCVFDIINDPCELHVIENEDLVKIGKRILSEYKENMIYQIASVVEPASNPNNFGGVWMPWDKGNSVNSFVKEFADRYLSSSFFLTLTLGVISSFICNFKNPSFIKKKRFFKS